MTETAAAPRRRFVDVADGQVHCWEAGAGGAAPLIMLHASPGSARMLRPLLGRLATSRRALALDARGNGDSTPLALAAPEIADFAAATLAALDALGIARFDLYGTHTGASIATEIAIQAPHRVRRLILESMGLWDAALQTVHLAKNAPSIEPDVIGSQFNWAWHYIRDQHLFWPWYETGAASRLSIGLPDAAALHELTVEVLKSLGSYQMSYRAAARYPKRDRLALLRAPTLVASARSDALHRYLDEMHGLVAGSQLLSLAELESSAGLDEAAIAYARFLDAP